MPEKMSVEKPHGPATYHAVTGGRYKATGPRGSRESLGAGGTTRGLEPGCYSPSLQKWRQAGLLEFPSHRSPKCRLQDPVLDPVRQTCAPCFFSAAKLVCWRQIHHRPNFHSTADPAEVPRSRSQRTTCSSTSRRPTTL